MNQHIDDNMTDLHVLALLKPGVKLSIVSGRIVHEKPKTGGFVSCFVGSFKRWVNQDNRKSGVENIYNIVRVALQIMQETSHPEYKGVLKQVITGLEAFQKTYQDDAFIQARTKVIMENIHNALRQCDDVT